MSSNVTLRYVMFCYITLSYLMSCCVICAAQIIWPVMTQLRAIFQQSDSR